MTALHCTCAGIGWCDIHHASRIQVDPIIPNDGEHRSTPNTKLSPTQVTEVQSKLRAAMNALDACGQDDLSLRVHDIFKEVARRAYPEAMS